MAGNGAKALDGFPSSAFLLQDDADEPSGALVDDAGQGLLELAPGILRHAEQLGVQVLADQLVE